MKSETNKFDLTIMVTCYNEETVIRKTFDTVLKVLDGFDYRYEVLVFDDGSKDNSVSVINQYIDDNNLQKTFTLVANQKNEGIAVNYFRGAELGRGEYYWIVHGDNAMWVSEGKKVIDLLGKADIIIPENGTRLFSAKHNFDHRSFGRRIISRLFAILVRLASGIRLWYFNGLILTKRERVLENRVGTYGFGYMAEILCKALSDPEVNYLEVRVHNYDRAALPTSAFKTKNVLSVIASLWRILIGRCKGM